MPQPKSAQKLHVFYALNGFALKGTALKLGVYSNKISHYIFVYKAHICFFGTCPLNSRPGRFNFRYISTKKKYFALPRTEKIYDATKIWPKPKK